MASIHISLNDDDLIELKPTPDISENDWLAMQLWWHPSNAISQEPNTIYVTVGDFSSKKQWLRTNWTTHGHAVSIDNQVLERTKCQRELIKKFELLSARVKNEDVVKTELPELSRGLTEFQERNFKILASMENGANFSVPGAGKTATTLAVWEHLRHSDQVTQLLVICPKSAFEVWREEPKETLPGEIYTHEFNEAPIPNNTDILYVNFEQLENDERLKRVLRWMRQSQTMLVIDEAHRIKAGPNSLRWQACLQLARSAARVDVLTGTPMPQSLEDLRNLISLTWCDIPRSYFSDSRLRALKRNGAFVRTTKSELELPPTTVTDVYLNMSPIQSDIYAALKNTFAGQFALSESDSSFFQKRGKAVMSLLATATNPGLLLRSCSEDSYRGFAWPPVDLAGSENLLSILNDYASHEISEKYMWVAKYVANAASMNRKVIIWSTFVGNLIALSKLLAPYDPAMIYGATNVLNRDLELKRFRFSNQCTVLLTNPQTLGEGVSLHNTCHEAIYVDRSYNAGLYLQSLDRIHRLGLASDQETKIFILQSRNTIDMRVAGRLKVKVERLGDFLDDPGLATVSLPTDGENQDMETSLGFDRHDINDLLAHLRS